MNVDYERWKGVMRIMDIRCDADKRTTTIEMVNNAIRMRKAQRLKRGLSRPSFEQWCCTPIGCNDIFNKSVTSDLSQVRCHTTSVSSHVVGLLDDDVGL